MHVFVYVFTPILAYTTRFGPKELDERCKEAPCPIKGEELQINIWNETEKWMLSLKTPKHEEDISDVPLILIHSRTYGK